MTSSWPTQVTVSSSGMSQMKGGPFDLNHHMIVILHVQRELLRVGT